MWRRFIYTTLGALAGYGLGAIAGMTAFAAIYGNRSISILEEGNRNRLAFICASAAAVLGGLVGWWRSYGDEVVKATGEGPEADSPTTQNQSASSRTSSEGASGTGTSAGETAQELGAGDGDPAAGGTPPSGTVAGDAAAEGTAARGIGGSG